MIPIVIPDNPVFAPLSWLTADLEKEPVHVRKKYRSEIISRINFHKSCLTLRHLSMLPVEGYEEKNDPQTFAIPRPNSFRRAIMVKTIWMVNHQSQRRFIL